ncbi:efflux RND transporter periplasmic adaptor subunit [Legionella sp. W05-934-2]|jgi:RND family efflux transporter MFP subunit|uniref:efflux RND transporter periplasmic adaptor subunit n=1 Tax=Legionella sp. W05-934-2 TaxID=1198649 RepID=UPI003462F0DB
MTISKEKLIQYGKIAAIIIIVYLIFHFVFFNKQSNQLTLQPPKVVTAKPVTLKLAEYVTQTGNTVAYNTVDLVARVEGYLEAITFTDGTFVRKGSQLFVIQPKPYLEKLKEAQAAVQAAEAGLNYAKSEYNRQQRMYRENATSKNSVEVWLAKQEQAEADLSQSKANLVNAEINYSYTHVKAPFDGRIGRHFVDEGNLVGNGQATKLATIEQIEPIYVYFNLNELDLLKLRQAARKEGITAEDINEIPVFVGMQNESGYPHEGRMNFINTGLNPSTGTLEFRAILKNKNLLFVPGLFVKVRIPISQPAPMLTVPETAVLYDQIGPYILTVDNKQTVVQKYVQTGPKEKGRIAISKGLSNTDDIIVQGLQFATPGNLVRPQKSDEKKS